MKNTLESYLLILAVLIIAGGAAWFILKLASPSTAQSVTGNEAAYGQLQNSILNNSAQ